MSNPNPEPARAAADEARRARAKERRAAAEQPGEIEDVRRVLWRCIGRVEKLTEGADNALVLRAAHALVQACGAYVKVLEVGEYEARLAEIEARLNGHPTGDGALGSAPSLTRP
jgi:hypothetical protein